MELGRFLRQVLAVLKDQTTRGQVMKMTEQEARQRFPDLVVASLGAQRENKFGGAVSARVLFDGTHGITVNTRTRIRDQERGPIPADLKRIMREKSRVGVSTFALTADVSEATQTNSSRGTGLASPPVSSGSWWFSLHKHSGYVWRRVSILLPAVGRVAQYLGGNTAYTWHMLVADDYHLDAGGANCRTALFHFFTLCATANVPLSWSKTAGSDVVSWVGFELLHRKRVLGITQRRADWLTKWSREVAAAPLVNVASFEGGLGRVIYVVSALEYERPFLAPLYRFVTMHPRGSTRRVPAYVRFILNYIAEDVSETRHYPCDSVLRSQTCPPPPPPPPSPVDAQASDDPTGVGGWLPHSDEQGRADPRQSYWFSLEVTPEDFPWV